MQHLKCGAVRFPALPASVELIAAIVSACKLRTTIPCEEPYIAG